MRSQFDVDEDGSDANNEVDDEEEQDGNEEDKDDKEVNGKAQCMKNEGDYSSWAAYDLINFFICNICTVSARVIFFFFLKK